MADLYKNVVLYDALGHDVDDLALGSRGPVVRAYIDSGSSNTIISERIAKRVQSIMSPVQLDYQGINGAPIDKRGIVTRIFAMQLQSRGCEVQPIAAAVSNALIKHADIDAEIILGNDFLGRSRVTLHFGSKKSDNSVKCRGSR